MIFRTSGVLLGLGSFRGPGAATAAGTNHDDPVPPQAVGEALPPGAQSRPGARRRIAAAAAGVGASSVHDHPCRKFTADDGDGDDDAVGGTC